MKQTSFERYCQLAKKADYIPVWKEILLDLDTPVGVFGRIRSRHKSCFLLESAEYGKNLGRFSFIGFDPKRTIYAQNGQVTVLDDKGHTEKKTEEPVLDILESIYRNMNVAVDQECEGCIAGFVGFLSFEEVARFETIRFREKKKEHPFDAVFFQTETLLIFDHLSRLLRIVCIQKKSASLKTDYQQAFQKIDQLIRMTHTGKPVPALVLPDESSKQVSAPLTSNIGKAAFIKAIKKIKQYICQGDVIQVVFSHKFTANSSADPFVVYRALRAVNPSPYMFYLAFRDLVLVGSSPEVLVKKEGKKAVVRPIAGTRPRGENEETDKKLEEELKRSKKEMAEHLMLVDLGRNDIGRVCEKGSVHVSRFAAVERYSHVMHLVSNVEGKLRAGMNAFDLIKAVFPAGTVSGAPKIRAMEIISELEPVARGPYAGALGYVSFQGDMDFCILIRTIYVNKGKITLQAGAGIVHDSNPAREYEETLNKAKALARAIEMAGRFKVI